MSMKKFITIDDRKGNIQGIFDLCKVSFATKEGDTSVEIEIDSVNRIFDFGDKQTRDNLIKGLVD